MCLFDNNVLYKDHRGTVLAPTNDTPGKVPTNIKHSKIGFVVNTADQRLFYINEDGTVDEYVKRNIKLK